MSEIEVISAAAPSVEKMGAALEARLRDYAAEDIVGISHSAAAVSSRDSGGVWGGAKQAHITEYSAIVVIRRR